MELTRRGFIGSVGLGLSPLAAPARLEAGAPAQSPDRKLPPLKLGLVTYNLARAWDLPTLIKNCTEAKVEGVELRTTHAHGVEVSLSAEQRKEVRKRFSDSPVRLASLGSAFEFHSADPAEVRKNIDGAMEYARLAADLGAEGFKVRPNGVQTAKGIPEDATFRQIGASLAEVGEAALKVGVQVRVEVHGQETSRLPKLRRILDLCPSANVHVCWNSNQDDLLDGGLESNFALVREKIRFVHLRDLHLEEYPWRKLFRLLRESGYGGYACAEIPESSDGVRVLKYFRGLFLAYQDLA